MDLIDKIIQIQQYNSLPFGEFYEDSLVFNKISDIKINRPYIEEDIISLQPFDSFGDNNYSFSILIENVNNVSLFLMEAKNNIIVKYYDDYIMLKDISSLFITNHNNVIPTYEQFFYNPNANRRSNLYTDRNSIKITGYAKELHRIPNYNTN